MVTVKLRGVNTIRKRLADGSVKVYRYHRATGTLLPGQPGSAEFLKAYADAEKMQPHDVNNVAALIRAFLLSPRFERSKKGRPRAESTKKEYRRMLTAVEAEFGKMPIAALASPKVRAVFADYHEKIGQDRPREADNRMTVLSLVFSYAASRGSIKMNPLEGFERLYSGDRSEIIWTEADVSRFMADAPIELKRAMILAIHTGQRYGDLIRLTWSDFDGTTLRLKQSKTKARVAVRCTAALLKMFQSAPRTSTFILTREDGRPWFTDSNDKELGKAWRRHMEAAGFYPRPFAELTKEEKAQHLHFNDLRGTAVTLLAEAGATIPQICVITGHTLASATRILERYLAMTEALSSAAIVAFENAPETAFANRLQTEAERPCKGAPKTQGHQ